MSDPILSPRDVEKERNNIMGALIDCVTYLQSDYISWIELEMFINGGTNLIFSSMEHLPMCYCGKDCFSDYDVSDRGNSTVHTISVSDWEDMAKFVIKVDACHETHFSYGFLKNAIKRRTRQRKGIDKKAPFIEVEELSL